MYSTSLAEQAAQCRALAVRLAAPERPIQRTRPRQLRRVHLSIGWRALHAEGLHQLGCTALAEPIDFYMYLLMLAELLEHEGGKEREQELCASIAATPQRPAKAGAVEVPSRVDEHAPMVHRTASRQAVAHGL